MKKKTGGDSITCTGGCGWVPSSLLGLNMELFFFFQLLDLNLTFISNFQFLFCFQKSVFVHKTVIHRQHREM